MNFLILFFEANLLFSVYTTYSTANDSGSFHNYENYDYYDITSVEEAGDDDKPFLLTTPKIIEASIGDTVLLPCEVNGSDSFLRIWKKGDHFLYQENIKIGGLEFSNIDILENATLVVKVQSDDNMGEYTCHIVSLQGTIQNVTHKILLWDDAKEDPVLTSSPRVFDVIVGEAVFLPCEISNWSSHHTNNFSRLWKKGEVELLYVNNLKITTLENVNISSNGTLSVKAVSETDTNRYTCEIVTAKDVQAVYHKIVVFPKLTTESEQFEVNFGDTVVLPCDVHYDNALFNVNIDHITRTWTRKHVLLFHGKTKHGGENVNLFYNGSLRLTIHSSDDLNQYSCSIVSAGGKIYEVTHIVVSKNIILPKLLTKPQVFTIKVGESLLLPCEISYPYNDVARSWIRVKPPHSGQLITNADYVKYSNGTLKVKIGKDDDLAEYSCIVNTSRTSKVQKITHQIKIISASTRHTVGSLLLVLYVFTSFL